MIAGQGTDHLVIIIQDRICTETTLDHNLTDVIQVIIQMEEMEVG